MAKLTPRKKEASGIATLDADQRLNQSVFNYKTVGVVDSSNLPGFVDDVVNIEYWQGGVPDNPVLEEMWFDSGEQSLYVYYNGSWIYVDCEQGKIYVAIQDNSTYRWSGVAMISLANPIDFATTDEATTGTNTTNAMSPARVLGIYRLSK